MRRRVNRRAAERIDRMWHAAMMAHGPTGLARDVWHATTWDAQHQLAEHLMRVWEQMPPKPRLAYAFPNPEDR